MAAKNGNKRRATNGTTSTGASATRAASIVAMRATLDEYLNTKKADAFENAVAMFERLLGEKVAEAKTEAAREAQAEIAIPNLKLEDRLDYYDAIQGRLAQVDGILRLIGEAEPNCQHATWGARTILEEVEAIAGRAFTVPAVTEPAAGGSNA